MKLKALIVFFLMGSMSLTAQKSYQLQSPDEKTASSRYGR